MADLAWEHVWQSLAGSNPTSSLDTITKGFIQALTEHEQRSFDYVVSNYAIRFRESARKVQIGPVEAILAEDLVPRILKSKGKSSWNLAVGQEFEFMVSDLGILIQLPPVCWNVKLRAAPGNIEEEAIWLINIAVSLLRLSYPDEGYDFFPGLGGLEVMPDVKPKVRNQGITVNKNGISAGGGSAPPLYVVDDRVVEITEGDKFKAQAEAIFAPGKGSLADRFSQGLGWLTRGRQTGDRAERFLFFFTAIEALLSNDDKSAPVVQTIARYASAILHDNAEGRIKIAEDIKSLYSARSALVHAGKRQVSKSEANSAQLIAEELYVRILRHSDLNSSFQAFHKSLSQASYGLPWLLPEK